MALPPDRPARVFRSRLGSALVALASALASTLATGPLDAVAAGTTRPDLLPDCAYGASAPGLRGFESRVRRDAWGYADGLADASGADRRTAARTFAAAEVGYVYGLPLVELHDTVRQFRFRNTIVSVAALTTPETRRVVSPNVDTAYSVGWLSLTQGPLLIDVPNTRGRFYTFQFMDAFRTSSPTSGRVLPAPRLVLTSLRRPGGPATCRTACTCCAARRTRSGCWAGRWSTTLPT